MTADTKDLRCPRANGSTPVLVSCHRPTDWILDRRDKECSADAWKTLALYVHVYVHVHANRQVCNHTKEGGASVLLSFSASCAFPPLLRPPFSSRRFVLCRGQLVSHFHHPRRRGCPERHTQANHQTAGGKLDRWKPKLCFSHLHFLFSHMGGGMDTYACLAVPVFVLPKFILIERDPSMVSRL
ncbi:hypothetical protein BT67DRAFT_193116 [Trichocladium antarcticum]|uniref:Uncharacterized protein n=1 Tax=Trichocladium antarcticum TaxID=1450529 RepID=A0AAN6UQ38_9PEZI|nr:hypothetical protein BT67DRAFT_193116 [Trichocladium antarcticum]